MTVPHAHAEPFRAEDMIACPQCDVLHWRSAVSNGQRVRCARCNTVLMAPRTEFYIQTVSLSVAILILMVGAVFFPFLGISVAGSARSTAIYEVAFAFSDGILLPLSIVVLALILLVPLVRAVALIYAVWPLAQGRRAYPHSAKALRLSETMQPWSMAEVFVFGTSVALVKIAGLASVSLGPGFWAFCALVLLITLTDNSLCKWTLWQTLEDNQNS